MCGKRYGGRPVYFSDVVVRSDSSVQSFADLRGAAWAYNELTSQSGYNITRYTLAIRGETGAYFSRVVLAGSHQRSLVLVLDGSVDAAPEGSALLASGGVHRFVPVVDSDYDPIRSMALVAQSVRLM
jgi:phosphonate transport system substrate-binding protein